MNNKISILALPLILLFTISGCAQLQKQVKASKPSATLIGTRIANINFDQVDLIFDVAVKNDNPFSLRLAGLDYDLKVGGRSLISGITGQGIKVKKSTTSKVGLPVSLKFDDLRKIPGEIWQQDQLAYQLDSNINIKLPIIGDYAIPFSTRGELPVPKLPSIRLQDLQVKNLNLTSADVVAIVEVDNPNSFNLALSRLNYKININQKTWGQGLSSKTSTIPKKGKGQLAIPMRLNLLEIGKVAYQTITSGQKLDYQLLGNVTVDTGLKLLRKYKMPLDINGTTSFN